MSAFSTSRIMSSTRSELEVSARSVLLGLPQRLLTRCTTRWHSGTTNAARLGGCPSTAASCLGHQNGRFRTWNTRLRRNQRLTRFYPTSGRDLGDGYYDSASLPSLLLVFKQYDVICACFDEKGQSMLEGSPARLED